MVIKRELAEKHPWAITNILKAFNQANALADRQRAEHVEYHLETGLLPAQARKALQTPIISHGIIANRLVLETIAQYSLEQGLTPRLMKLDELFAASMMAQ
jgi:4,5-dihydroxyphthalate decarboxylase